MSLTPSGANHVRVLQPGRHVRPRRSRPTGGSSATRAGPRGPSRRRVLPQLPRRDPLRPRDRHEHHRGRSPEPRRAPPERRLLELRRLLRIVSGDGSAVIFTSLGSNYAAGRTWGRRRRLRLDPRHGAYERVSVRRRRDPTNGFQDSVALTPRLSHDARFAVFASRRSWPPPHRDDAGMATGRQAGTTEAVCIDSTGATRTGYDAWPSDDGGSWPSTPTNPSSRGHQRFADVYLRDRQAGPRPWSAPRTTGRRCTGLLEPTVSATEPRPVPELRDVWLWDRQRARRPTSPAAHRLPQRRLRSPRSRARASTSSTRPRPPTCWPRGLFVAHVYLRDLSADE